MNKKHCILVICTLVVLIIFPEIYLYPFYKLAIKPVGESYIENTAIQAIQLNNTSEKLQYIMEWEVKDFKNVYGAKPVFCLGILSRYQIYFDSSLKIRAINSRFSNDPYWVAYFKAGGCGELAYLFCEVTNRSGLEARVVETKGEDHSWNEVKVDQDGSWMHVDPTLYFLNYPNITNDIWVDNSGFYDDHWFNISRVSVTGTGEDRTRNYTDVGILNISVIGKADRILITTLKNGKTRPVCKGELNNSVFKIELGGKKYTITVERELIPYLIYKRDVETVEVIECEEVPIELSPEKLSLKSVKFYPCSSCSSP